MESVQSENLVDATVVAEDDVFDDGPPGMGCLVYFEMSPELAQARGVQKLGDQGFVAEVVYVAEDGALNLSVTDHCGNRFAALGVPFFDGLPEIKPEGVFARWA